MNTETLSDCRNPGGSSSDFLPTLTEVTFRPHSQHCCSFTAVVRDDCDVRGVSFSQLARLIGSISHVGKIDDFTVKPLRRYLFLSTGFSRHTPPQLSSRGTTLFTAAEPRPIHRDVTRIRPQDGKAVDAGALASQGGEPWSSDDESGLSDSDPDSSSDDGCLSEDDQGHSSTRKHSSWPPLDEQRLLAYKKEGKPWGWTFGKFPGRTQRVVRTRWTMIWHRVE